MADPYEFPPFDEPIGHMDWDSLVEGVRRSDSCVVVQVHRFNHLGESVLWANKRLGLANRAAQKLNALIHCGVIPKRHEFDELIAEFNPDLVRTYITYGMEE